VVGWPHALGLISPCTLASIKTLVSAEAESTLFKWVAILTGSKNTLKGVGFFLGAILLEVAGFRMALAILAGCLFIVLITTGLLLPKQMGKAKTKPKFTQVFSNQASNNETITWIIVVGLIVFGIVFAINSAVHSYLILAYADNDKVSMNVGFYYMANAGGRLAGTLLSGLMYQFYGLSACLWVSSAFVLTAAVLSLGLPKQSLSAQ